MESTIQGCYCFDPTNSPTSPSQETSAPIQITKRGQYLPVHHPFLECHLSLVAPEVPVVLVLQGQVVSWGSVALDRQDPGAQLGQVDPEHLVLPFVLSDLPRDKRGHRL